MIGGSLLFVRAPCAHVIPLAVTGCVSSFPCAPTRAHYFARYLTVTVKIRTLKLSFQFCSLALLFGGIQHNGQINIVNSDELIIKLLSTWICLIIFSTTPEEFSPEYFVSAVYNKGIDQ